MNKIYENPDIVVWEITLKCNLNCMHCGSSAGKTRPDELSTKEAIKLCRDLADIGFKGIALMGGELFLRRDWYEISKEIKDLGIKLSIISNGFVDAKKIVPMLTKLGADCVMVGLDGASPKTQDKIRGMKGAFEKAIEFLRECKRNGLTTGVITTVHKLNLKELPKIRDLIVKEEFDWQIQEATPIGRFPRNLALSEEEYYSLGLFIFSTQKKYSSNKFSIVGAHNFGFHSKYIPNLSLYPEWNGCYAGKTVLGIQSNGNIKGCLALPDEFIEGNIRERSVVDIWNDPDAFTYNRKFKVEDLGENCRGCKYGETCKGGCMTRSVTITGKTHNDPSCFYRFEKQRHL
ncbi:radical SAM protein [Euryarchaeota archaeon ex4484_162]|nr:MAG: radical SAM protein [Euryarchaeota archaeon ex4484_162]